MPPCVGAADSDIGVAVQSVLDRIHECNIRAFQCMNDEMEKPVIRDLLKAYLTVVCNQRLQFMLGGLHNTYYANLMFEGDGPLKQGALENLIVRPPARWDFIHTYVFGTISDACCCANRYGACAQFFGVEPLRENDPIHPINIMLRHKETSPWYQRLKRRRELKCQLGRKYKALVGYARDHTKAHFMQQWDTPPIPKEEMDVIVFNQDAVRRGERRPQIGYMQKPGDTRPKRLMPYVTAEELLLRTGYTPEQFWRECKKPNSVKPRFSQLELGLDIAVPAL